MIIISGNNGRTTYGPSLVSNGLALLLDAADPVSFSGSGSTVWNDLVLGKTASLLNGPLYDTDAMGSISIDNVNDYIVINTTASIDYSPNSNFTMDIWYKTTDNYGYIRTSNLNFPILTSDIGIFGRGTNGAKIYGIDLTNQAAQNAAVATNWAVYKSLLIDTNILCVGRFDTYKTTDSNNIIQLTSTGSVNTEFVYGLGANNIIYDIATESSGKYYIVGGFTAYNGSTSNYIARLNSNGTYDSTFNIGTGFNNIVYCVAVDSSNNVYCGGAFTNYNGTNNNRIIKLRSDGAIDSNFNIGTGFNDIVWDITFDSSNNVYCGGQFTTYNGSTTNRIARLSTTGSRDATFDASVGFNNTVYNITLDSSGKIYSGGDFTSWRGVSESRIIRLNTDGSKDATFNTSTGFSNTVNTIKIDGSGNVFVGGAFQLYQGLTNSCLVKLTSTASKDTTFDNTIGIDQGSNTTSTTTVNRVYDINFDGSGNLIIVGKFLNWKGVFNNRIIRITSTGSKDATFDNTTGFLFKNTGFNLRFGIRGTNLTSGQTNYITPVIGTATWCNISVVHMTYSNYNQYSLYYNGSFTFSATYSSNVDFYTGNQYNICNGPNIVGGNNDRINGKVARVMLYGRGLSSSEILQNFNANRTRFGL